MESAEQATSRAGIFPHGSFELENNRYWRMEMTRKEILLSWLIVIVIFSAIVLSSIPSPKDDREREALPEARRIPVEITLKGWIDKEKISPGGHRISSAGHSILIETDGKSGNIKVEGGWILNFEGKINVVKE